MASGQADSCPQELLQMLCVCRLTDNLLRSEQRPAEMLGGSTPTVSRDVTALRQREIKNKAERQAKEWRYVVTSKTAGSPKTLAAPITLAS